MPLRHFVIFNDAARHTQVLQTFERQRGQGMVCNYLLKYSAVRKMLKELQWENIRGLTCHTGTRKTRWLTSQHTLPQLSISSEKFLLPGNRKGEKNYRSQEGEDD